MCKKFARHFLLNLFHTNSVKSSFKVLTGIMGQWTWSDQGDTLRSKESRAFALDILDDVPVCSNRD
jgi:hypothetical protein